MNFLQNLFIILSILVLIEENISKDVFIDKDLLVAPLALIKKPNSLTWELATPQKSTQYSNEARYFIEDKNELKEEFKIACAASSDRLKTAEKLWREPDISREERKLFFMREYPEYEELAVVCREPAKPSIQKIYTADEHYTPVNCGKAQAELYEVGYPVSLDSEGEDVEFVPVYKICHSTTENVGTLYTIHQIASPDLMMQRFRKWYEPEPSNAFKSYLDRCVGCLSDFYHENKYFVYQFVGMYDMPTKVEQLTTYFHFNFIPVKHKQIFMGLLRADQFVQLFSRKTNQPLTLYSGKYQTTVKIASGLCKALTCTKNVPIELFWKIIVNSENHAIVLITQLTQHSCTQTKTILCKDESTFAMLETYKNGGCTYTCSVTQSMISELGLPVPELNLQVEGYLSLDFKVSEEQLNYLIRLTGGPSDANTSSLVAHQVGIADFMGDPDKFEAALAAVDAELVKAAGKDHDGDAHGPEVADEDDLSDRSEGDAIGRWEGVRKER